MNSHHIFAANSLVWPLVALLVALLVLRQVRDDLKPIVTGMVTSLAGQSSRYAIAWAMAGLYACAASFQALGEVATQLGWVYVAAAAKVLQPGLVAIIAYVTSSPAQSIAPTAGGTKPPFTNQPSTP